MIAPVAEGAPIRSPFVAVVQYTLRACLPARRWFALIALCIGALLFGALTPVLDSPASRAFGDIAEHALFGLILPLTCLAIGDAHQLAAAGTRFAGRPETHGFAAVEDASFLNLGGVTAVSYGPGDLRVAHADDEYVLIDELVTATKTYAILAMDWCGVG